MILLLHTHRTHAYIGSIVELERRAFVLKLKAGIDTCIFERPTTIPIEFVLPIEHVTHLYDLIVT